MAAVLLADLTGWPRSERLLAAAVLTAALACAGLAAPTGPPPGRRARPVWALHIALGLCLFFVVVRQLEFLALGAGLFLLPRRSWAWIGALAWGAVLFWGDIWGIADNDQEPPPESALSAAAGQNGPSAAGLVYLDAGNAAPDGNFAACEWGKPWVTTASTGGRVRPLSGYYRETSPASEFIDIESLIRQGVIGETNPARPHWHEAWEEAGTPPLEGGPAAAEALGARWYAACDGGGGIALADLAGTEASGVAVDPYPSEGAWHQAAARWWIPIAAGLSDEPQMWEPVPILEAAPDTDRPPGRAASGVRASAEGDRLTVWVDTAGWVWLRVPWDPYWQAPDGAAAVKGGPGHLVVWAPEGETELVWRVHSAVDAAAADVRSVCRCLPVRGFCRSRRTLGSEQHKRKDRPGLCRADRGSTGV